MKSSEYLEQERKKFALYVLQNRAIPYIADGLKCAGRRVLWTAKSGSKYKTATLAGATMPIHPHAAPEGVINTLTGVFLNNIPLFKGTGAFGTRLSPNTFASPRYTSVEISKFTKEVVFKDIELVELVDNYDQTLKEPKSFLPLVPIVLLNPVDGIGLGFATTILPRSLDDIINSQIQYLQGKPIKDVFPSFTPFNSNSVTKDVEKNGNNRWGFYSSYEKLNSFEIKITELPYGVSFDKFINNLNKLEENGYIKDYVDGSSDNIDIVIKFPRGFLNSADEASIHKKLGLESKIVENLTLLDFSGDHVVNWSYNKIIAEFCDFRLQYYSKRYERLLELLNHDISRYQDIILAIDNDIGGKSVVTIEHRESLCDVLRNIGVVNLEYIADLPVYRFTIDEKRKIEEKLSVALNLRQEYEIILSNESERVAIYINELKDVLNKYKKGYYS